MLRFLFRRLAVAIPTLFLVITATFFLMRAAPGGPFDNDRRLPPEIARAVAAKYGLDKPLIQQYGDYLVSLAHGDLGPSLKYKDKTVLDIMADNYRPSVILGLVSLLVASIVGIGLGVIAALRHNKLIDYGVMGIAILGVCVPSFVTAPLLAYLFASVLGWLPSGGWQETEIVLPLFGALPRPIAVILPVVALSLPQIAIISRLTRSGMIEVLSSNYIRTARAKGLPTARVVGRHALRGAITPLVSYLGPAFAGVLTGSLVIEQVFALPGLGQWFVKSALQRDYTVVMGMVILYASLILILNLIADMAYAALDPKVRLS
ncbi:MAG: ABC transporter permease subunit [Caulobacteraceae bacterium]